MTCRKVVGIVHIQGFSKDFRTCFIQLEILIYV
jgi:hypothetical protein